MAERLTERKISTFKDIPFYTSRVSPAEVIQELGIYEDLAEQGRLIILPCKPFEKVWVAHPKFSIHQTMFCCNTHILETMEAGYVIGYTKEEVEAKLKERGEQE